MAWSRSRRIVAALAALVMTPCAAAQVLHPATFIAVSAAVVRVEAQRQDGALSVGSGVVVAPAVVVTNCHVTRDATSVRVSGAGVVAEVDGERADPAHDVCFLRVPEWRGRPAELAQGDVRPGDPLAAIGFTGGTGRSLRFGRVRALHRLDAGQVIESDAAFTSGASGGGLFDASGALVGLLTFHARTGADGYYALPVSWIRERMPAPDGWSEVRPLPDAVAFWQQDAALLPFFMRAPVLFGEGRWNEVAELAGQWTTADPMDGEPWCVLGRMLQDQQRQGAAVAAFGEALRLAPDDTSAWYGLALAYAALGDAAASRGAQLQLARRDDALATRLRDEVQRLAPPR